MKDSMNVLDVNISVTSPENACQCIKNWIKTSKKTYVCVAPVSTVVDCQKDSEYKNIVNGAGMVTPDGMPLVWIGKKRGFDIQRTYGPDLMLDFCKLSENEGYKHYLYGGTSQTLNILLDKLKERFPKLNIAGYYSPPVRAIGEMEEDNIVEDINNSGADVLWVGLGSPKQDYWMKQHRDRLNVPVMVGVGAAFDFLAGVKKQAPIWMRRSGLEWLFRLCSEPRRLWRRYLIGNAQFIYYLLKSFLKRK